MLGWILLTTLVSPLHAEDLPPPPGAGAELSAGVELAAASRYVWRGMPASTSPTLQPSAWLGYQNISFAAWSNFNLDQADGTGLNQLHLLLSLSQEWDDLSFTPALVAYILPGTGYTAETTGDIAWQPGWFGLYSNHAIDFIDARPGWWSETGVSFTVGLPAGLGLDANLGASVANRTYNQYYLALDRVGLQYACAGLSLGWAHSSGVYAGLTGRMDLLTSDDIRSALGTDTLLASALLSVGWEGSAVWVR